MRTSRRLHAACLDWCMVLGRASLNNSKHSGSVSIYRWLVRIYCGMLLSPPGCWRAEQHKTGRESSPDAQISNASHTKGEGHCPRAAQPDQHMEKTEGLRLAPILNIREIKKLLKREAS